MINNSLELIMKTYSYYTRPFYISYKTPYNGYFILYVQATSMAIIINDNGIYLHVTVVWKRYHYWPFRFTPNMNLNYFNINLFKKSSVLAKDIYFPNKTD